MKFIFQVVIYAFLIIILVPKFQKPFIFKLPIPIMKKSLLTLFIGFTASFCFSQPLIKKQTLIPLSNVNGVPFYKDDDLNDIGIQGFEVDDRGNFYFASGIVTATIAGFSGNKQLFHKAYKEFRGSQPYFYKNALYMFDNIKNDLWVLNSSNGSVIKKYSHITPKSVAGFLADSFLILESTNNGNSNYNQYSLDDKYIKAVPNQYNIPPAVLTNNEFEFLGKWNESYVFWSIPESKTYVEKLWLMDKKGQILASRILPDGFSGNGYAENPREHRKVRNGSFYVLGRIGKNALITEVPLASFFGK
jgi:hypothetical protein